MIKAIIFDLDNTLIDRQRAFKEMLIRKFTSLFNDEKLVNDMVKDVIEWDKNGTVERIVVFKKWAEKYKLAILTNGNASSQRRKLNTINIYDLLDYSLVSSEYIVKKPDKQIFEYTAKQLGLETYECIYVGDNYNIDVLGSRNAGMTPIYVSRNDEIHEDVKSIKEIKELLDIL